MKRTILSKPSQIKSILGNSAPELDGDTARTISRLTGVETFDGIYDVSLEDIMLHVATEGWDPRVVQVTSTPPIYNGAGPNYYLYIGPGSTKVMTPMDRGEWLESEFADRRSAEEYIAKSLIWSKWSDINYEWVKRSFPNNTRPLKDLFPAPCNLMYGDI